MSSVTTQEQRSGAGEQPLLLLSAEALADRLGFSARTIWRLRSAGKLPAVAEDRRQRALEGRGNRRVDSSWLPGHAHLGGPPILLKPAVVARRIESGVR